MNAENKTGRIVEVLGGWIVSGNCTGELPKESELRWRFGVSRAPLREAVKVLTAKGLLTSRPRGGTFVQPSTEWNLLDPDVLRWLLAWNRSADVFLELKQLRLAIEPEAAALAALHATAEQKGAIMRAVLQIGASRSTPARLVLISDFHARILRASGNRLHAQFGMMMSPMLRFTYAMAKEERDGVNLRLNVAEAINRRDAPRSGHAMRAVIERQTDMTASPERSALPLATAR